MDDSDDIDDDDVCDDNYDDESLPANKLCFCDRLMLFMFFVFSNHKNVNRLIFKLKLSQEH